MSGFVQADKEDGKGCRGVLPIDLGGSHVEGS